MNRKFRFRVWDNIYNIMSYTKPFFISETLGRIWWESDRDAKDWRYVLMEGIGLKDKNGKEIFEGDILKQEWPDSEKSEMLITSVCWSSENARYIMRSKEDNVFLDLEIDANETEIIGNIYANPELL